MSSATKDARWQLATDYANASSKTYEDHDYEGWKALLKRAQLQIDSLTKSEIDRLADRCKA